MFLDANEIHEQETDNIEQPLRSILVKKGKYSIAKRSNKRLYASSVGHCERKGAIEATQRGLNKRDIVFSMYVDIGTAVEETLIREFDDIVLFSQYRLPELSHIMGGIVDAVVAFKHKGEYKLRLVEIKTTGSLPDKKPKPEHYGQANLYSAVTGIPNVLFYVSREVSDWTKDFKAKEFHTAFDPDFHRLYIERTYYSALAVQNDLLPNMPDFKYKYECGYCEFAKFCWNEGNMSDTEVKHFLTSNHIPLKPMSSEKHKLIQEEAKRLTDEFMHPDEIERRRNGIVNHILHNTKNQKLANELKKIDWDNLFTV